MIFKVNAYKYAKKNENGSWKNCSLVSNDKGIECLTNKKDHGLNIRLEDDKECIVFGDIDHCPNQDTANQIFNLICDEFNVKDNQISKSYSFKEDKNEHSYHWSITSLKSDFKTIKHIFNQGKYKEFKDKEFKYMVDTNIYKNSWFRLPYQTTKEKTLTHEIIQGNPEDFLVQNIPEASKLFEYKIKEVQKVNNSNKINNNMNVNNKEGAVFSATNLKLLEKIVALIDIKYCDNRSDWIKIVLAMRNVGFSFEFAESWSKRSGKYSQYGMETCWDSYTSNELITVGEGTIRYYANLSCHTEYVLLLKEPINVDNVFTNDADVSDKIIELLNDRLLYCDGRMYMKIENCWICDQIDINKALMTFIMNAEIYKQHPKNGLIPHWKNFGPAEKVYKTICCRITESSFDKELFHSTTKHRIAFKNGVLDFKAKHFYTWDEVAFPYYTTNIVNTNYKVETEYESLVLKVFEPIFGDKTELALKYISRAIAGCIEDKNFATYMGNRNCGKGALFELLSVFGSYVVAFNLECLKEETKSNAMTAKDYYWMMPLEFARLAISQEVPKSKDGCVLRSDLLKKICSGGDTLTARRNYDRKDTQFKVECSMFCLGNDEITTHGDVNEHRLVFEGATSFISQDQYDSMVADGADSYTMNKFRIADEHIKTECKSYNWQMKVIALLLDRFIDERIVILPTDIEDQEDMSPMTKLLESYNITRIESHLVLGTDIHEEYGKKVKAELKAIGIQYKRIKRIGLFRDQYCYVGLLTKSDIGEE